MPVRYTNRVGKCSSFGLGLRICPITGILTRVLARGQHLRLGRTRDKVKGWVSDSTDSGDSAPGSNGFEFDSVSKISRTRRLGRDARKVATHAVNGAIKAADEITVETTEFVRDAVVGVIESTGEVARVSRSVVRDVVSAAVRSSTEVGGSVPEVSKKAVEGAVVGATSVGANGASAGAQASAGVAEAVQRMGGDFREIVGPTIHGVVTGVVSTTGNLLVAMRDTSYTLMVKGEESGENGSVIARLIVDEAINATRLHKVGSTDAVVGAVQGCVIAAYEKDRVTGEAVEAAVLSVVNAPVSVLSPTIRRSVSEAITDLSGELGARPQAWRGVALWRAGLQIVSVTGVDVGAALAYYTLLAFFPMVALLVLVLSGLIDPMVIRNTLTEILLYYFPGTTQVINEAVDHLFEARLLAGLIALGGMMLGILGLVTAANRGVNRVFGCLPRNSLHATVSSVLIVFLSIMLFLMSLGLTVVLQIIIGVTEQIPAVGWTLNRVILLAAGISSGLLPLVIGGIVFVVVYRYLPNVRVRWSDATFGGIVTVLAFEVAKHVFLWSGSLMSHRSLVYGSLSSVILLLIWSHVAGVIFLYGAALTKQAGDLRPRSRVLVSGGDGASEQTQRNGHAARGRGRFLRRRRGARSRRRR